MADTVTGPPIIGALLTGEYQWWRPAVFSGVRWEEKQHRTRANRSVGSCIVGRVMLWSGGGDSSASGRIGPCACRGMWEKSVIWQL